MNHTKLYNVIFPLWIIIFVPPYAFIPLVGNLLINGIVIYAMLRIHRIDVQKQFFVQRVLATWGFGFLADIAGAVLLYFCSEMLDVGVLIWSNPKDFLVYLGAVLFTGYLIYLFNRWLFSRHPLTAPFAYKIGCAMGSITAPWMFMIPPQWFH